MSGTIPDRMGQRLSLITLGFDDLPRGRSFYDALGCTPVPETEPDADIVFYQGLGMVIALWDRAELATDTAVSDPGGWGGITLAHCVASREGVDAILTLTIVGVRATLAPEETGVKRKSPRSISAMAFDKAPVSIYDY